MMKTLTRLFMSLAVTCCLFAQNSSAQNILDPNFADAIREVCPACIDDNDNLTSVAQDLDSLNVSFNNISNLVGIEGFISLIFLNCGSNQLDSLPALPASLMNLVCHFNQLNFLPVLPANLTTLDCSYNYLNSLPTLPANLTTLDCSFNQLNSLPTLPTNLATLYCSFNQLNSLPALPASLIYLGCSANHLASLPALPDSLSDLYCQGNPPLSCLPLLPSSLKLLYTSATQITCIPNLPVGLYVNPPRPLCSEPCDSTTSTSIVYTVKPFMVQPNPVSEMLQVRFSGEFEENADFRLLDSGGRIVRALSGKGDVEIPVGDLPAGIYWLEVRGAKWVFGEKILKK